MVNKVILIGRLGKDPEAKTTASGLAVTTFPLATSERERAEEEHTEWHRVVLFGKAAEAAQAYLKKGRLVYIEGRIRSRSWEDSEGKKRYSTEIVGDAFKFLDGGGSGKPTESSNNEVTGGDDIPF